VRRRCPQGGTTLAELLICIGVMAVVLFLSSRLVTYAYEFYRFTDESISLQREGILALQALTTDMTISHQRSIVVTQQVYADPTPSHREDHLIIPLPQRLDGSTEVNEEGASKWMTVAAYEVDQTSPSRNLIRHVGDTANDVGNDFFTEAPAPIDYVADIESVAADEMPTVAEVKAYPQTGLRQKSVCRNVLEFKVTKRVDTFDVDLTIFLTGRVRGGISLDNSLSLNTTIFPRN
jgi:hypothetical protein